MKRFGGVLGGWGAFGGGEGLAGGRIHDCVVDDACFIKLGNDREGGEVPVWRHTVKSI